MKATLRHILAAFVICCPMTWACNLSPEVEIDLTEEDVFHTYNNTKARANAVYLYLPNGLAYMGSAMLASATDEAEFINEGSSVQKFNTGSWNAINNPDGAWDRCWNGIYAANKYLENCDDIDLDYLRLDTDLSVQAQYKTYVENLERWKYEVRFLRAYYYYELIQRYGGVPVMTETYDVDDNDTYLKIQRNSFKDCVEFILSECDDIEEHLPARYSDEDLGRVTRGCTYALKARVLLIAASDLFNDTSWCPGYSHPELINMGGDRTEQWAAAAEAAHKIATYAAGGYSLSNSYSEIFTDHQNAEIIMARRYSASNDFERTNYSVGFDNGSTGNTPSQNLVDAYENTDGTAFSWDDFNAIDDETKSPYNKRDPRLAMSIITNGSMYKGHMMECYEGGKDGKGTYHASNTGYYIKKFASELDLLQGRTAVHVWPIFRLGEFYLEFAEAMNEAYGPTDNHGYSMNAVMALNKIRQRRGVALPAVPSSISQDELREKIRHERQVELAFEGYRAFDVRRWMIAEETLGVPLRGVDIKQNGYFYYYTPKNVEERKYETKMNLYPIPQTDLNISNWPQNPLW